MTTRAARPAWPSVSGSTAICPPPIASKDSRQSLGRRGEAAAESYLRRRGYRIVDRGWRPAGWKRGEIDLIAIDGGEVVFVEVKTRRTAAFGRPEEAVDWRKRRQLRALAWVWLAERQARQRPFRIDVIAITVSGDRARLRHLVRAVGSED